MAENIVVNGVTYNGVDSVEFETPEGECVAFFPPRDGFLPAVITPGDTPVVVADTGMGYSGYSGGQNLNVKLTIPQAGTYRIKFWGWMTAQTSSDPYIKIQLFKNNTAVSNAVVSRNGMTAKQYSGDMALAAGDVLSLKGYGGAGYDDYGNYAAILAVGGSLMACAEV